jgi:hypothetical protein
LVSYACLASENCLKPQVVEYAVDPDIVHFVSKNILRAQNREHARRGNTGEPLAYSTVGQDVLFLQEKVLQVDIALQRKHAAIVAIHGIDAPS